MSHTLCSIFMYYDLSGGLVFGILTDKFGRKPTYFIANILMASGGILAALAPEFFRYTIVLT